MEFIGILKKIRLSNCLNLKKKKNLHLEMRFRESTTNESLTNVNLHKDFSLNFNLKNIANLPIFSFFTGASLKEGEGGKSAALLLFSKIGQELIWNYYFEGCSSTALMLDTKIVTTVHRNKSPTTKAEFSKQIQG